jgi:hypothetical protein
VLATLATKNPKVALQMTADGAPLALTFKADGVYAASPIWDAGSAPSMCAAVVQPPTVPEPMLTLVAQLESEGSPTLRIQASGVVMGERDLAEAGKGLFTGSYLPNGAQAAEAMNFASGKITLARGEGGGSAIKLSFADTAGTLAPSGKAFTLDGNITATVGAR